MVSGQFPAAWLEAWRGGLKDGPNISSIWLGQTSHVRATAMNGATLSLKGLKLFTSWFLRVCLDQLEYMDSLFDLKTLGGRIKRYVYRQETLPDECAPLLQEALVRGEFERGEASRITGLPDRSARRVLKALTDEGLLASVTEKGPVSLRFPVQALDTLFPRLYPEDV